jgi:hypothetical protein
MGSVKTQKSLYLRFGGYRMDKTALQLSLFRRYYNDKYVYGLWIRDSFVLDISFVYTFLG